MCNVKSDCILIPMNLIDNSKFEWTHAQDHNNVFVRMFSVSNTISNIYFDFEMVNIRQRGKGQRNEIIFRKKKNNSDSMKPLRCIHNQTKWNFHGHTYQQYLIENPSTFSVRYSLGTHKFRSHVPVRILFAASNLLNRLHESPANQ